MWVEYKSGYFRTMRNDYDMANTAYRVEWVVYKSRKRLYVLNIKMGNSMTWQIKLSNLFGCV